jgi:Glyoxalase-like domain
MRGRSQTKWWGGVLDAPDAHVLAEFYSRVLDWPIANTEPGWAVISRPDTNTYLAFQTSPDYAPPVWPSTPGSQQMMMHLDIEVDDLDEAVGEAIQLGARLASHQPQDHVRVLLDPAGHPFCLYLDR